MAEKEDYEEFVEVPLALVMQAVGLMSADAKMGYKSNATRYADLRHGTSRALADFTDVDYTDYPDMTLNIPEEFLDENISGGE